MVRRALVEKRPFLLSAIALGIFYYLVRAEPIGELWLIPLKGSAVAMLALYAWQRHTARDARILSVAFAVAAIGDMALEIEFTAGGAAFALSHAILIGLFLRNRKRGPNASEKLMAGLIFLSAPVVTWFISDAVPITIYAVFLGTMAATAWLSRFPRSRVGLGAILFMVSDWLIFGRALSPFADRLADIFVWPLYVAGQFLIAVGVIQTMRRESPAST
ncbi:lysoplasmalogenase [Qipengyuania sp. JC766]|uniref:lysoplasmalogenase n=1 Tax=Qipengyuania sp. JC766 TaxID=3232139 RepID=UPI003457F16E